MGCADIGGGLRRSGIGSGSGSGSFHCWKPAERINVEENAAVTETFAIEVVGFPVDTTEHAYKRPSGRETDWRRKAIENGRGQGASGV
jgi:hypothetical protein